MVTKSIKSIKAEPYIIKAGDLNFVDTTLSSMIIEVPANPGNLDVFVIKKISDGGFCVMVDNGHTQNV